MEKRINIVELASELADAKLNNYADALTKENYDKEFPNGINIETEDEVSYTPEAQEHFDDYYDYYYELIEKYSY